MSALNGDPVQALRQPGGGDGGGPMLGACATRRSPRPSRPAWDPAAIASWRAHVRSRPSSIRRRTPTRRPYSTATAGVHGVCPFSAHLRASAKLPVDARHPGRRLGLLRAGADGGDGDAGRGHPRLLAGADHQVDAPGVHLEGHGAQAADAVDDDQRVARRGVHRRDQLAERVGDAGRGLVMGQQHRPVRRLAGQVRRERSRVGSFAPLDLEAIDVWRRRPARCRRSGRRSRR